MLVIGLEKPEDYEGLPALGNPSSYPWDPRALLVPAALFASALLLLLRGFRKTSAWAALIGCVFFIDGWPFRSPSQSPYLAKTPWTPYQRVIDYARGKGGLVFWAHPDAPNWKDPTAVGGPVDLRTKPYPDALLETANYDGFGIFQEGNRVTALPGGAWDEELGLFCDGRRKRPSWGIGELDYRSPETNFDIDSTEMILDAKGRSPAAVLESLRAGRFYVILPSPRTTGRLVLDAWDLKSANASAGQGGTLRGTRSPVIELEVSRSDGASRPADVEIIRGGSVILKETATLPHKWSFQDAGNRADRTYYRARLRDADGGELYTNPIFSFSKP